MSELVCYAKMRKMTRRVKQKVAESGKLNPSVLSWSQEAAAGDFSTRQHKPLKNLESTKGNPTNTTSNEQGNFCFMVLFYLKPSDS